ncbi:MAG: Thymidylate synthase [Planctomycetes bacterium]|nr:Thymidylate synthase [Planctomycetota bacterium]
MMGREDSAFLNYWFPGLPKFAGKGRTYRGAYGKRIRRHHPYDQLERAYDILRRNPDSRQVVLQIWDASIDMPSSDGTPIGADVPCNIASLLKVRAHRLEWTQVARSNDILRGVPTNIVQFTSMQEILAGWLEVEVGSFFLLSDSLHLYETDAHTKLFSESPSVPENRDSLRLPKAESTRVLTELERAADSLTSKSGFSLRATECLPNVPQAYANLFAVLAAEKARRTMPPDMSYGFIDLCDNDVLRGMWLTWANARARRGKTR